MKKKKIILTSLSTIAIISLASCNFKFVGSSGSTSSNGGSTIIPSSGIHPSTSNGVSSSVDSKYSLIFENNGHGIKPSQISNIKIIPSDLPLLEDDKYNFEGWYLDETLTNKAISGTIIQSDTVLYAKWVKKEVTPELKYTITYVINGHGSQPSNLADVDKIPSQLPILEAAGYNFNGWYLDKELTKKASEGSTITSNIILYASWTKKEAIKTEYTVSFNTNGGSSISNVKVIEGNKLTKPADPVKENAIFKGWYLDDTYNEPFDFDSAINKNLTLYAKWVNKLKVSFVVNDDEYTSEYVESNTTITKPADPIISGFKFEGWYESLNDEKIFDFETKIVSNITLYAKLTKVEDVTILYEAYDEGINLQFKASSLENTNIYYKETQDSSYKILDKELIRISDGIATADVLGLRAGIYDVKVTTLEREEKLVANVTAYDRSGYAHFNQTGIGAYNDDGTLKTGTNVVYVTEATKNTVTCTINKKKYTGLVAILNAQSKSSAPLDIRIIGQVSADTWKEIKYEKSSSDKLIIDKIVDKNGNPLPQKSMTEQEIIKGGYNTLEGKYEQIKGITNSIKYSSGEFDSYYNMIDVSDAKNVTIEGVGSDAKLYQCGFTWKKCSSIEVRNLTFDDYTEDACSFEGSDDATTLSGFKTGHIWIHNNTFNEGNNKWDVCPEQDKHEGDGTTDFKKNAYITLAYNHYYKNHKTGLVGGSDTQHTACVTFHHNYYENCTSRLPLGRQANMHMYNNYYYKSTGTNMSIRANGYAFVENCYVEACNNPFETKGTGIIKLYSTTIVSSKGTNTAVVVSSREEYVKNSNLYSDSFDTNSSVFYYDTTNKKTNVSYLTSASQAKADCIKYAGVHKFTY